MKESIKQQKNRMYLDKYDFKKINKKNMTTSLDVYASDQGSPIVLTKNCSPTIIELYFKKVLEISRSGIEFPVNLEEVWPLVYGRKEESVRSLKSNFIQDVDYKVLRKNAENSKGGRPTEIINISLSCMEFFIARKVREVFEVYRKIFHKAASILTLSPAEQLLKQAQIMVDIERRQLAIENEQSQQNERIELLEAKATTRQDYFSIAGYGSLNKISINKNIASSFGKQATKLCIEAGIEPGKVNDERYGTVGTYPEFILKKVFNLT